jgi:hypothetical protein
MREPAISFYLNDHNVAQPDRVRRAVRELARAGFRTIISLKRETVCTNEDPAFIEACRAGCEEAAACGVQFLLDIEPCHVGPIVVREHPEAAHVQLVRGSCRIRDGRFEIRIAPPLSLFGYWPSFIGVQAAFVRGPSGAPPRRIARLDYHADFLHTAYGDWYQREVEHMPYRAAKGQIVYQVEGSTGEEGELIVYAAFRIMQQADMAAPEYAAELSRILGLYRGMPAGGVVWDEPFGGTGEWGGSHKCGIAFARSFRERTGVDLLDVIWMLDEEGEPGLTARVRHGYYATLTDALFRLQGGFFREVKQAFGDDVGLGTHHTWTGEGSTYDLRAGCFDYFTLTKNMGAGFVDTYWYDARMAAYTYPLASSLGKAEHGGKAFSNCYNWGQTTRREQAFQTRLMALHRVDWFAMNWGDECEWPNCYPLGKNWQGQVDAASRLAQVSTFLAGAGNRPGIAIWHGWEGVVRVNEGGLAHYWKTYLTNTAWTLQERNVAFDFTSSEMLAEGRIEQAPAGARLVTRMGTYTTVVMGYACMMPKALWERLLEFAAAGGHVILVGPPPACTTDGDDICGAFADLVDIEPVTLVDYLSLVKERFPGSADASGILDIILYQRPPRIDFFFPAKARGAVTEIDAEGDPWAVHAMGRAAWWLTGLDPQEKLADLVSSLEPAGPVTADLRDGYWRAYEPATTAGARFVLAMARSRRRMDGVLRWREGRRRDRRGPRRPRAGRAPRALAADRARAPGGTQALEPARAAPVDHAEPGLSSAARLPRLNPGFRYSCPGSSPR